LYDLYVNDFCVRNQVDNPATQSINQSINEISIAPPTKRGRRRLTV